MILTIEMYPLHRSVECVGAQLVRTFPSILGKYRAFFVGPVLCSVISTGGQKEFTHIFKNEHIGSHPGLSCMPFKLYYVLVVVSCDFFEPIKQETTTQF